MKRHSLKTWPRYFAAVRAGLKPFEIRLNDRDFQVGDILDLEEYDPGTNRFTGETECRRVTYMTEFAQQAGYVVLGMAEVPTELAPPTPAEDAVTMQQVEQYAMFEDPLTYLARVLDAEISHSYSGRAYGKYAWWMAKTEAHTDAAYVIYGRPGHKCSGTRPTYPESLEEAEHEILVVLQSMGWDVS